MRAKAKPGGEGESTRDRILDVVRRVPVGRVATYGQIAALAGLPGRARQTGYALRALDGETDVPWHRIVNARGAITFSDSRGGHDQIQRVMLEAEGVAFSPAGRIDMDRFAWDPGPGWKLAPGAGIKDG